MSKTENNFLYICGKCGGEVSKDDVVCPKCKARLGNIRCPYCNYIGSVKNFKNDICPVCGRKNKLKSKSEKSYPDNKTVANDKGFLAKYFKVIFLSLLAVSSVIVLIFLKYFNLL